jgi:hypothetical protein
VQNLLQAASCASGDWQPSPSALEIDPTKVRFDPLCHDAFGLPSKAERIQF